MTDFTQTTRNKYSSSLGSLVKDGEVQRYAKILSFFIEIGNIISKNPDKETLVSLIIKKTTEIMGADRCTIFVLDKEERELWSLIAQGLEGETIHFDKVSGISGHVLQSGRLLNVPDAYESPYFNCQIDKETGYRTKSVLCAPLINANAKVFGVLQVLNKISGTFNSEDEALIQIIASQISIAYENINTWNELSSIKENLIKENISLRRETKKESLFPRIIGMNNRLVAILKSVEQVAHSDIPVMIEGESGTGKELIAKAIHANSKRSDAPFVCINCSAIPENLLESELFGYEKGAFTGAQMSKLGLFEEANTGTLFLDEIGDMDPRLQVKILRFLQSGEIQKIGNNKVKRLDVRIIAATNRSLSDLIKEGRFREDLYYRINVVNLRLPPLRERKDDIPLLVRHFLKRFGPDLNKNVEGLAPEAAKAMLIYDYPGNVRELENIIKRSLVLSQGKWINVEDLPEHMLSKKLEGNGLVEADMLTTIPDDYGTYKEIKTRARRKLEEKLDRQFIVDLLEKNKGNVTYAAMNAKMNRSLLQQLISKYSLDIREYR